jgi:hypothetical protein
VRHLHVRKLYGVIGSLSSEQALEAGCAFVNCISVFIASDKKISVSTEIELVSAIQADSADAMATRIITRVTGGKCERVQLSLV